MPALEPQRIAQLRAIMPPKDFPMLLGLLRTDLEQRRGTLLTALEAEDRKVLRDQAHAMAGVAANAGAQALHGLAKELEAMADHAPLPRLGTTILAIVREEQAVQQALRGLAGEG